MEVPVPRNVSSTSIPVLSVCPALARWRSAGTPCIEIMLVNSRKRHPHIEEHRLQCAIFGFGQVALCLFRQHAQQVDGLPRTHDVHARTLSFLGSRAHLDHRRRDRAAE